MWAVLLGCLLVLAVATSSHAAIRSPAHAAIRSPAHAAVRTHVSGAVRAADVRSLTDRR